MDEIFHFSSTNTVELHVGDCLTILKSLPIDFQTCVTSPPYYNLRDYNIEQQIGLESTPEMYITQLVLVFREVRRILHDDGTLWLNLGDSYAANRSYQVSDSKHQAHEYGRSNSIKAAAMGAKPKDLLMIPSRVALALQADGWYIRSHIIWEKPNVMPESVRDRPTSAHESVFLLAKSRNYYYDADAVREPHRSAYSHDVLEKSDGNSRPLGNNFSKEIRYQTGIKTPRTRGERAGLLNPMGRNLRNVWSINTKPFREAHFATMAPELAKRCILAGCPEGGSVLDPFGGAGTTGLVAAELGRKATLIELNPGYADIIRKHLGHIISPTIESTLP